jgi:hypothetical protein
LFGVPDEIPDMTSNSECEDRYIGRRESESEVFRGYWVVTRRTERGFGGPDKCWGASWAKGREHTSPLRGCAPPHPIPRSPVKVGRPLGLPPPGLGGKPP